MSQESVACVTAAPETARVIADDNNAQTDPG